MKIVRSARILLLGMSFLLFGCGDDDGGTVVGPADGPDQLVLTLENLGDPSPYHFALWAVSAADTGLVFRFSVLDGAPVTLAGDPIPSLDQESGLGSAEQIWITVESDTLSVRPGSHRLLAGTVGTLAAELTTASAGGWGVDLSNAAGAFLFDTPTTDAATDCGRGVWWTDGEGGAGLTLPTVPSGWKYEGWVVDRETGTLYSTGRFSGPTGADSDGGGATGGGDAGYDFPGQDFVTATEGVPVLQVDDGAFGVSVTLEPDPDISSDPFFTTLLERNVAAGNFYLRPANLPPLATGIYYEIWADYGDTLVSVGQFRYVNGRVVEPTTLQLINAFPAGCNLANASTFLISLETDADPDPSGVFVMAGDAEGDSVTLSYSHPSALGSAYDQQDARFVLDTPTTLSASDYDHGLWFYEEAGGVTTSTLAIPDAPEGWFYQAWVFRTSGTIDTLSMGTFQSPNGADSDSSGPYAGTERGAPPFPGQDFVTGVSRELDNGRHAVMVSIEPTNDPFPSRPFLVLFQDIDIDPVAANETQSMSNLTASFPSAGSNLAVSTTLSMEARTDALPAATLHFGKQKR